LAKKNELLERASLLNLNFKVVRDRKFPTLFI